MINNIKVIHVDKDGTFSLSEDRNKRVIEDLAAEYGIYSDMPTDARHLMWKDKLWSMCEGQAEKVIHSILVENFPKSNIEKVSPVSFEKSCKALYNERHNEVKIRSGVIEMLRSYKEQGVLISMVTSSDKENTDMDLETAFGEAAIGHKFFDAIITSDDMHSDVDKKPSPVPYLKSCHALGYGCEIGNVILEDSPAGRDSAISCFGKGDNLVIRFLEADNFDESDHDRLVHAYNIAQATDFIEKFEGSLSSDDEGIPTNLGDNVRHLKAN